MIVVLVKVEGGCWWGLEVGDGFDGDDSRVIERSNVKSSKEGE